MIVSNVEKPVTAIAKRLVYLKIKANRFHAYRFQISNFKLRVQVTGWSLPFLFRLLLAFSFFPFLRGLCAAGRLLLFKGIEIKVTDMSR
jgi:hypothetical protein